MSTPLFDLLAAAAPEAARALGEPAAVEDRLAAACRAAAETWPGVHVEAAAVV